MAGKNPMQSYQEATNQLLNINAQRKSRLEEEKMAENITATQNNTLLQASGFVSSQQPQAAVNANLNPATQNILGNYGLGQPKIQKSTSSSQQVTKENIVINNKSTNITNNNVQVPANIGGPVQSRPIQFQDPSQIKFKTWLSNSFAQQNEMSEKRKREYAKRDAELVRTSNKLMTRLKETGTLIANSPKNMASSMTNQLKTLLIVFGFAYLAKNWPKLMRSLQNIETKVIDFFSPDGGLAHMLGGKEGESVGEALRNLFLDKDEGILAFVSQWLKNKFEERREAVKKLVKPDVSWKNGAGVGNNITRILGSVVGYLGDILSALMDPSTAAPHAVKGMAEKSESEYQENNQSILRDRTRIETYDGAGNRIKSDSSAGDKAIVEGSYAGVKPGSIDKKGNLINTPAATIAQGNEIQKAIEDARTTGHLEISKVATGLSRLQEYSKKNGNVILSESFLRTVLGDEGFKELGLKRGTFVYVSREKTDEEKAADVLAGRPNPISPLKGALAADIIALIAREYNKLGLPETTLELKRPSEIDPTTEKTVHNIPTPKNLYEVTPEALQKILDKATNTENANADLKNESYVSSIRKSLEDQVTDPELKKNITRDIDVEDLYSVNHMMDQHSAQMHDMWERSRLNRGVDYTTDWTNYGMDLGRDWLTRNLGYTYDQFSIDSGDVGLRAAANSFNDRFRDAGGHVYPLNKYRGLCTAGPATFYEDAGIKGIRHKFWEKGKTYHNSTTSSLGDVGFKMVWHGTKEQGLTTDTLRAAGYDPKPGDIMLLFAKGLKWSEKHPGGRSGHGEMWNGQQWVSDKYQGQRAWCYSGGEGRLGNYSCQVWRYDTTGFGDKQQSKIVEEDIKPVDELVDDGITDLSNYSNDTGITPTPAEGANSSASGGTSGGSTVPTTPTPLLVNQSTSTPSTEDMFNKYGANSSVFSKYFGGGGSGASSGSTAASSESPKVDNEYSNAFLKNTQYKFADLNSATATPTPASDTMNTVPATFTPATSVVSESSSSVGEGSSTSSDAGGSSSMTSFTDNGKFDIINCIRSYGIELENINKNSAKTLQILGNSFPSFAQGFDNIVTAVENGNKPKNPEKSPNAPSKTDMNSTFNKYGNRNKNS